MNHAVLKDFEAHALQVVRPVAASPRRKCDMRDELLAHVWEAYEREFRRLGDDSAAVEAAKNCLGNPDDLRHQLQESVPFLERMLFTCLGETENPMYRFLWVVGVVTLVVELNFAFAYRDEVHIGAVALICGLCVWHLRHTDNLASRWLGPRWPWLVGAFAVFFGPGIVLPALAQLKHGGRPRFFFPLGLGILITLIGFGYLIRAMRSQRMRVA